ncbi:uncharacterized protein LOC121735653 [Aricia agestis]|uniref:uncharacterized protein LOC121735653 n=1 Tax=Aricia agestis TaxID=91739 RepID=UPI001C20BCAC|nr:uncharacterized protein LOC121735653 [Aricia agestis]
MSDYKGDKSSRECLSSTSTSSDEEPATQRKRKSSSRRSENPKRLCRDDEVLLNLVEQVSQIQNFLAFVYPPSDTIAQDENCDSNALNNTCENIEHDTIPNTSNDINFDLTTNLKEPAVQNASTEHLQTLNSLQHFNSENWSNVRYSDIQKTYNARPGFIDLEVNDELKQFEKANNFNLNASDKSLGAITRAVIMQNDALKKGVSDLLQWTQDSDNISRESLLSKIKDCFSGDFQKISLDCLQLVCGRRADIIEQRREYFLNLVKENFLKSSLKKIPPSCEYLFNKEQLSDFIKNNGGVNNIFIYQKPAFSAQERRPTSAALAAQPGPSNYKQTGRFQAPFGLNSNQGFAYYRAQAVRPFHPYAFNYNFGSYANNERFFRPSYKPPSFPPRQQAPGTAKKPFNQSNASRGRGRGDRKF